MKTLPLYRPDLRRNQSSGRIKNCITKNDSLQHDLLVYGHVVGSFLSYNVIFNVVFFSDINSTLNIPVEILRLIIYSHNNQDFLSHTHSNHYHLQNIK